MKKSIRPFKIRSNGARASKKATKKYLSKT